MDIHFTFGRLFVILSGHLTNVNLIGIQTCMFLLYSKYKLLKSTERASLNYVHMNLNLKLQTSTQCVPLINRTLGMGCVNANEGLIIQYLLTKF